MTAMTASNELRLNRNLLNKNFEGYKLSLSPIPVYKEELSEEIEVVSPSDDQYSFLHHREFSLHNHILSDPWNQDVVYFVDSKWKLRRSWMNELERLEKIVDVFEIPRLRSRISGDYNVSLCFASNKVAVLGDGTGHLYVIDTYTRTDVVPWKILIDENVLGEIPFSVIDARCIEEYPHRILHCILLHIERSETEANSEKPRFDSVLTWVIFHEEVTGYWSKKSVETIKGKGTVDYATLELSCKGLYLISDKKFAAIKNKGNELVENTNNEVEGLEPDFHWQQSYDDIKVWIEFPEGTKKSEVNIIAQTNSLTISRGGTIYLSGNLHRPIDPDLTMWTYKDHKLEVTLQKSIEGTMWHKFIESNKIGKEILDEKFVAESHEALAHLCSEKEETGSEPAVLNSGQLEECDIIEGDSRTLLRFEAETCLVSHKVFLGSQQWIFKFIIQPDAPPAFCLRNDVDGCVWQPKIPSLSNKTWECEHIGTFLAFGYVQASKQNKKFIISPPDMSYIAIIDVSGHVIIYREGESVSGSLRNRKTGKCLKEVAIQHLVNLHTNDEILGASASTKFIFVLTKTSLNILRI